MTTLLHRVNTTATYAGRRGGWHVRHLKLSTARSPEGGATAAVFGWFSVSPFVTQYVLYVHFSIGGALYKGKGRKGIHSARKGTV